MGGGCSGRHEVSGRPPTNRPGQDLRLWNILRWDRHSGNRGYRLKTKSVSRLGRDGPQFIASADELFSAIPRFPWKNQEAADENRFASSSGEDGRDALGIRSGDQQKG